MSNKRKSAKGRGVDGGAERFKFVVRIATIHGFRFVACQLNLQLHQRCVVLK